MASGAFLKTGIVNSALSTFRWDNIIYYYKQKIWGKFDYLVVINVTIFRAKKCDTKLHDYPSNTSVGISLNVLEALGNI